ncbi:T9SS type A sorting domain-containing protein [Flaviaesturariibacter terrae]
MKPLLLFLLGFFTIAANAQTSWKGTASTSWTNSSNWTNGVPSATKAAVVGDASFTGAFQPTVASSASCAGLTLGGTVASTLTLSKNLSVSGSVVINSNGTFKQGKATLTVSGSWTNNGTYSYSANQASTIFSGTAATLSGTSTTAFRKVTINANAVLTASSAFSSATGITVSGTLAPESGISIPSAISVSSTGTLRVTAATLSANFAGAITLNGGSTVDYNSTGAQTISSSLTYSTLRISGSGTRSLTASLSSLNSSNAAWGNLYVDAGVLDLAGNSIPRGATTTGGTLMVANGATLRLSGSNFPSGFNTNTLSYTSTVEYYGAAQTVSAKTYGYLTLSGSGTKTLPTTAFTVANAFTTSGTLTANAGANMTVSGAATIGTGTTLTENSWTVQVGGNLVNNGSINGGTGTLTMAGAGASLSGTGTWSLNNLTIAASGTTSSVSSISLTGNLATTGSGVFTHTGGAISMSGSGKTISGSNITLNDLTVTGTGSVTASSGFTLSGNLSVAGSLTSSGILVMGGSGKTISGAGSISLNTLSATGSLTTATSFTIGNTLDVTGSLAASAGTVTFSGTCLYNGTASLFNVTLSGTSSLQLAANSSMGIAGALSLGSGTLNATTTTPNTVIYNGSGLQNISGATYDNLTLSNGSTKTAAAAITVNTDLTISSGTTFAAGAFTHTVKGNWTNSGSFTAGSSSITLSGGNDATLTGATTFNVLTINKTNATNSVFLANNMTTPTLNMTNGILRTQTSKISITGTRSGSGYIYGTIERVHSFSSGTDYAFEGADNVINFTGASGITAVTVVVTQGNVSSFPFGSAINRSYTVSVTGTYTSAKLRLHYEDVELNGNTESGLQLYRYNGSSWVTSATATNNTTSNYAEQSGISTVTGTWTLSSVSNVVSWNGSASTDWNNAANWTTTQGSPSLPPSANDIVQIGNLAFTNQPTISTAAQAKSILFGSAKAAILTMASGGSLTTQGNISGSWSSNVTHSISVGAQTLTVNGNILLSDGTTGHAIDLSIGSGTVSLSGSLTESGGANVSFTGAGGLTIGGDFTYSSGTFSAGSGTVTYNGGNYQSVGGVTYNQLVINKTAATATTNPLASTTVSGNLLVSAGTFDFSGPTTIVGDVTVASGAFATNRTSIQVGGNWTNNGTYLPNGGSATFNGTGAQSISSTAFNKIIINKASGTATLTGNLTLNSDLLITAGTLDMKTFTANRNTIGGTLQLADGATLYVGGAANFPANYTYYTFGSASNTVYNGTVAQSVSGISYGNLSFANGGTKTLAAPATVQGNLSIGSGATLDGAAHNLTLYGNWTNSGTFTPSSGAVLAMGSSKTITGNTTFNKLTVYGSYTVAGSDITYNGPLTIVANGGSFDAGSGTAVLYGNLTNSGSLVSSGTTTFAGTQAQTIQLINAITSTSTGVINFNGTVAPTLNSTSTPTFATLNINNTGGISPSVNWTILGPFTIASGASFNGGVATHTIAGNFTNNGVVTSSGTLLFSPSTAKTANLGTNSGGNTFSSTGTVQFGGTGALTVSGTPTALDHVIISNTNAVSPSSNWSNISGTFSIDNNGVFNAGANTYTLAGNMESNGTLNGGTSNFIFTSATAQISGSPSTTLYDMLVNTGAALTVNSEFNVSHDLTINGTVDASLAGVTFNGAINGNLTGSASSLTLADFDIEKTSGYSLTLQKNIIGITDLNVSSGNLDMGAFALTQDAVNTPNTLTIENYARLRIGSTSTLPAFTTYQLDSFSVVEYYGGTQALSPTVTYGCLEITAGAKTTSAALTLLKNMTISGGSFTAGSFTHNIGGNWLQTGGTFTSTGSTILFNGVSAQTVTATDAFNNMTLSNDAGLSLGSAVSVGGTLALSTGKVTLGAYSLTVSSGSISGATSAKYIVAGAAGALVQPIAASTSRSYPVGTTNDYIPATIAFAAGSTADNISVRVKDLAYVAGESGSLKMNSAVNATWVIDEAVAGGSNATVTLQWPATLELTGFTRSTTRLAHFGGSTWDYGTVALSASGSNPYTLTRSGFTSFSPFSVRNYVDPLPVTWLAFSGQRRSGSDELQWSTATESNNGGFTVEESSDGRNFTAVATVAGAGNSTIDNHYHYTRRNAQGTRYYRIRQTDLDGRYSYTSVIRLSDGSATGGLQATFGANPVRGNASVQLTAAQAGTVQLALFDAQGRALWQQRSTLGAGTQTISVPLSAQPAGVYFLAVTDADGGKQTLRMLKE